MQKDEYGYACPCGQWYDFPPFVFNHRNTDLAHPCPCGRVAHIRNTHVFDITERPQAETPHD